MKKPSFIEQLKQDREKMTGQNNKIIECIVESCLKNIQFVNHSGTSKIVYEVPSFLLGFPVYDKTAISILVNKKLKKMGFSTTFINVDKILISW